MAFLTNFVAMKTKILSLLVLGSMVSCQPSADEKAAPMMRRIDSLYQQKQYARTLDAIRQLREQHPQAVETRRRALVVWQEASLRLAQADIARTDSALQATIREFEAETHIGRRNLLGVKRDSLQVRYDALCGTVRVIHRRQKEG